MENRQSPAPLVRCIAVAAPQPSLQDNRADADRLKQALAATLRQEGEGTPLLLPFALLAPVAAKFRSAGFRGCALVNMLPAVNEIVDFLPEEPPTLPGLALDLGTTHLEAALLDLRTGATLAAGQCPNRQIRYGADILSRIHHAAQDGRAGETAGGGTGLAELRAAVVDSINELADTLSGRAGCAAGEIRAVSVSGNTTMVHLLLGLSPYHICREPYIPLVNAPDPCHGAELGLAVFPFAPVWIMPSIGSYFGGDLISGILATELDQAEAVSMLIDVGTNAEVVLGNREWLIACAGAAGPALEGGVARMGMRAGPGAVEHVTINRTSWQLACTTIDREPAEGICGSGLIDLVAELYLARIIDFRGKFRESEGTGTAARREFLRQRLVSDQDGTRFIVVPAAEAAHGRDVVLTQTDLDALMRSKAAMYAILTTLAAQVGVAFGDLARIYVAGAFGRHIDPRQAITLGMLPDLPLATYQAVGNSSLRGAVLVLLSGDCRRRSMEIRGRITYLELNVNQEFMHRFSGGRFIPHADPALFPSVPRYQEDSGAELT
ncbi:MAG: ASKHA domain-containing protein [Desulfobulbaceae bacterium]